MIPSTILVGLECVDESSDVISVRSTLVPSDGDKPVPISEDTILISLPASESADSESNRKEEYMVKYLNLMSVLIIIVISN